MLKACEALISIVKQAMFNRLVVPLEVVQLTLQGITTAGGIRLLVCNEEIEDVDKRWQSFHGLIGSDKLDHLLWRLAFQILLIFVSVSGPPNNVGFSAAKSQWAGQILSSNLRPYSKQSALKGLRMIVCMHANRTFVWFSLTRWTLALVRVRVRLATCAAILAR